MGPIILVPFIAAVAVLIGASEPSPPPPQEVKTEVPVQVAPAKGLVETYRCSLFNRLLDVDDLPEKNKNRFLIIAADDGQTYDQVWLNQDHYGLDYEVSSRYYEFKDLKKRQFWPKPVQEVIATEGFDLKTGQHGNYRRYVQLPQASSLMGVGESMLRIMEDGFGVKAEAVTFKVNGTKDLPLAQDEACRELSQAQKDRAAMPVDGGANAFQAAYANSLHNRLVKLATMPPKSVARMVLSAGENEDKVVRLWMHGKKRVFDMEIPKQSDPAMLARLKKAGIPLKLRPNGVYRLTLKAKTYHDVWEIGDKALEVLYDVFDVKTGALLLMEPPLDGSKADTVSLHNRLPMNEPLDRDEP